MVGTRFQADAVALAQPCRSKHVARTMVAIVLDSDSFLVPLTPDPNIYKPCTAVEPIINGAIVRGGPNSNRQCPTPAIIVLLRCYYSTLAMERRRVDLCRTDR